MNCCKETETNKSSSLNDNTTMSSEITSSIQSTIINSSGNACPLAIRLAWHAAGTFDQNDTTPQQGGSNGATMRFEPELSDGANAGLKKMQEMLEPIKTQYPGLSYADLWTMAGAKAVKFAGGPDVPFKFGRSDDVDGTNCPANGRLPDASQGAAHLRDVFYRMGFDDKEIVALSGAHTLGRCHTDRSGFEGPWTSNPLKFDNEYFRNLLEITWTKREWDGPMQYTDPTGQLMMLPSDLALIEDETFLVHVKAYAADENLFFEDFASAFSKLLALGCPAECQV